MTKHSKKMAFNARQRVQRSLRALRSKQPPLVEFVKPRTIRPLPLAAIAGSANPRLFGSRLLTAIPPTNGQKAFLVDLDPQASLPAIFAKD